MSREQFKDGNARELTKPELEQVAGGEIYFQTTSGAHCRKCGKRVQTVGDMYKCIYVPCVEFGIEKTQEQVVWR